MLCMLMTKNGGYLYCAKLFYSVIARLSLRDHERLGWHNERTKCSRWQLAHGTNIFKENARNRRTRNHYIQITMMPCACETNSSVIYENLFVLSREAVSDDFSESATRQIRCELRPLIGASLREAKQITASVCLLVCHPLLRSYM
jgi:hypothetical protein